MNITGLDGEPVELSKTALDSFTARLQGTTLQRGDGGYDEAIHVWNGMVATAPALVVQPVSIDDVRETVDLARCNGLLLSVKGGGHNIAGTSLADGGVTLDMSRLRAVEVDPERRVARVGAGCLLGDVDRATQQHGLATVLGSDAGTGVAGLTLGGGFGYVSRRFGWAVDNLDEVEIVTADGKVRRAAADEHDDLLWAVRGGGGNFGVVTGFRFRLHEVGPQITGGLIAWDGEQADDVLALYREMSEAASRELTLVLALRNAPPAPFLPERWHGRPIVGLWVCHTGDASKAVDDLAAVRAFGKPIVDLIGQKTYVDHQFQLVTPQPKGLHYYWKSEFLPGLTQDLLDTCRSQAAAITSPRSMVVLFQLGGAIADRPSSAAAFDNRDAAHIVFVMGTWEPGDPDASRHRAWTRSSWESIRPFSTGGNYVNAQTADEDESRTLAAYGSNHARLTDLKRRYDPDNLFRVNRNIAPAAMPVAR